jgi:hypothetical protein
MKNPSWMFVRGDFRTVADIDAALSAPGGELDGSPLAYAVRVHHELFRELMQPSVLEAERASVANEQSSLDILATRLKGNGLAILPVVPPLHELAADSSLTSLLTVKPLRLSEEDGKCATFVHADEEQIQQLRTSELAAVVLRHRQRALLSVDNGHFELPSGAHTSHFFRLAECLTNVDDLDIIVYWIARDMAVRGADVRRWLVLVDNPSTLVIALRLAQVFPKVAVRYDCLPAYPEYSNGVSDLKAWLEDRMSDCDSVYCIVSVSSTGKFTKALSSASKDLNFDPKYSVLYATTPDATDGAYCVLEIPAYWHSSTAEQCVACQRQDSAVFRIDKARYFLTERNVTSVALPPPLFATQKRFIETYGRCDGVLRVHVDDASWKGGRLRAFSIDVPSLMGVTEFVGEIAEKIREITPSPDLVVMPSHSGARSIGDFLGKNLGVEIVYHSNLRLDPTKPEDQTVARAISNATSLLIVDDVAYTFERIQAYVRAIREAGTAYQAPPRVTLFPLLVLASNDAEVETAIRGIEADHDGRVLKVLYLHRFPLPNWDEKCCPWCLEAQRIRQLPHAFGEDEADKTDERGALLSDHEKGLNGSAWMSVHGGLNPPLFGRDSPLLYAEATPMQVLFACASAVQQARTVRGPNRLNPEGFPKSTVLGVQVLRDFQNETLLVVCLLRCLLSTEMAQESRKYVLEMIEQIGGATHQSPDLWALQEFLLSQMRGLATQMEHEVKRQEIYAKAELSAFLSDA